jgi:hypothetical protein
MPSFVFFDSFTTAQTLASGEFGFIGASGSLEVTGVAVASTGSALLSVYGTLSGTDRAVDHDGGEFLLNVGEDARIASDGAFDTIDVDGITRAFIATAGELESGSDALDIRGTGPIVIRNTGSIVGVSDGIVTSATGSNVRIVNFGTVTGSDGGIDHLSGDSLLVNRGTIDGSAGSYGFDAGEDGGEDEVRNSGSIQGGVKLEGGDDTVINGGDIDFIELGTGDDSYEGRARGSAGRVDGGEGRDTVIGSRANDVFLGGLGADRFVLDRNGGTDRILDFAGQDRIDLRALDFARFAAVRSEIVDRPNGVLIDLSDDGLRIVLRGVDKADLAAGDFIL